MKESAPSSISTGSDKIDTSPHQDDNKRATITAGAQQGELAAKKPKWWRRLSGRKATKSQRACLGRMIDRGFVVTKLPPPNGPPFELGSIFSNPQSEIVVELGFGNGNNLFSLAQQNPHVRYLGAEMYQPGVCNLLKRIEESTLVKIEEKIDSAHVENEVSSPLDSFDNLRIYGGDGIRLLQSLPSQSVSTIILTFPDPFPNENQIKWRILQHPTVLLLERVLMPKNQISKENLPLTELSSRFFLATDHVKFHDWTTSLFQQRTQAFGGPWKQIAPVPSRAFWLPVISQYESKGLEEGRETLLQCWELSGDSIN